METKMIGNKIAHARKRINISQAQLAQRLFISPQAVGKWERGESVPDIITLSQLAEILGVDLNYFSEKFTSSPESTSMKVLDEQPVTQPLNWDMSLGNWVDADFSGLKNLHEKFSSSNMQRCKFIGSDLSGLLLKNNMITACDFSGSKLDNSHIGNSHWVDNHFNDCSLKAAQFSGSHIKNCDFSGADLTGAAFTSCAMEKNTLVNVRLHRTMFNATHLANIIFEGKLEDCYFENASFSRVTFQNSTLTNTFFKCRSLKHIRFIDCQADRMTFEFLKNGKADMNGITLLTA
ncbi:helix-turn-helix domain-containing protein [Chitinophaga polysaccharea]|uniref:pentapeptide repeat-containing protein n=1 Tax=Chitinophaga TaxID=79328 RepID=UPI001454F9E4|nr:MULTISPECIES: pentapeptide repeat-containing protein [Chitinophaga]NLR57727.1 helix-turn-helix domain-containing protein [Chitinophaga polysaccharea]NLU93321.1 helix-turn-helix domain-containing protein [Chitinophaga sp. Ak27]